MPGDGRKAKVEGSPYWVAVAEESRDRRRHFSPSAARNTGPILDALAPVVPNGGTMLEVASGTGQHAVAFAGRFPRLVWQPSDADPSARESIAAWREAAGLENLRAPLALDLADPDWHCAIREQIRGIIASNLLHISPWRVTENLFAGAHRLLPRSGVLFVYGCFSRCRDFVSASNRRFDESLRLRNPAWGVRDTLEVDAVAREAGFTTAEILAMPTNNTVMIWRKT